MQNRLVPVDFTDFIFNQDSGTFGDTLIYATHEKFKDHLFLFPHGQKTLSSLKVEAVCQAQGFLNELDIFSLNVWASSYFEDQPNPDEGYDAEKVKELYIKEWERYYPNRIILPALKNLNESASASVFNMAFHKKRRLEGLCEHLK